MLKSQIKVGQVYAWSRMRVNSDHAAPQPVLILDTDTDFPTFDTYYRRQLGTHKGILGVFVDPLTLKDPGTRILSKTGHLSYSQHPVGTVGEVKPTNVWRGWLNQAEFQAYEEAERRTRNVAADYRAKVQQAMIDEFYSLVPESAWPKARLEPGLTPRFTVPELITIVKAARTRALDETDGEPGELLGVGDDESGEDAQELAARSVR